MCNFKQADLEAISEVCDDIIIGKAFIFMLEQILKENPDLTFFLWTEGAIVNDFKVTDSFDNSNDKESSLEFITPGVSYDIPKINVFIMKMACKD